ncbi:hypothetical protein SETIT_1G075100v2 [Setaria italica]|uniref:Uncharacterized protein n=1 Tax=Setaria italica TaxID=4555 RepID=K3Z1F2_SETIT|nr:hypothetical protein SETIT_1G075100v2 [Setaria italica]
MTGEVAVSSSSGSESKSGSDDEDTERERELERVLADEPFGELQRAGADGSLALQTASAAKAAADKKARRKEGSRCPAAGDGDKHENAATETQGGDPDYGDEFLLALR